MREIDFGQWEGLSWEQVEQIDLSTRKNGWMLFPTFPPPAGESFQAFEGRILEEVHGLLERDPGSTAVVTHAGVLRVVLRHLCGCSDSEAWQQTQSYCCVVRYEAEGESK